MYVPRGGGQRTTATWIAAVALGATAVVAAAVTVVAILIYVVEIPALQPKLADYFTSAQNLTGPVWAAYDKTGRLVSWASVGAINMTGLVGAPGQIVVSNDTVGLAPAGDNPAFHAGVVCNATTDAFGRWMSGSRCYPLSGLSGTPNRVILTGSGDARTATLPQDIHTGATPEFAGVTLGGPGGVTVSAPAAGYALTLPGDAPGVGQIAEVNDGIMAWRPASCAWTRFWTTEAVDVTEDRPTSLYGNGDGDRKFDQRLLSAGRRLCFNLACSARGADEFAVGVYLNDDLIYERSGIVFSHMCDGDGCNVRIEGHVLMTRGDNGDGRFGVSGWVHLHDVASTAEASFDMVAEPTGYTATGGPVFDVRGTFRNAGTSRITCHTNVFM